MVKRMAKIERKTKETEIKLKLNLDGKGKNKIETGIGFLDHMLEHFAFHGLFDLEIKAKGDLKVDLHHTNEDIGIVLGQAFKKAMGEKKGIKRFGSALVPMDEALSRARVAIDISGRGSFNISEYSPWIKATFPFKDEKSNYSLQDAETFLIAFANHSGININIALWEPETLRDLHHLLEALFKALGIALDTATQIDKRVSDRIPSTKGIID